MEGGGGWSWHCLITLDVAFMILLKLCSEHYLREKKKGPCGEQCLRNIKINLKP